VKARPGACFGPLPQAAPARDATAADRLGWYVSPAHTLAEHIHDAGQCAPIVHCFAAREPVPTRRSGRKERGCPLPQVIRNEIVSHMAARARQPAQLPATMPKSTSNQKGRPVFATSQDRLAALSAGSSACNGGLDLGLGRGAGDENRTRSQLGKWRCLRAETASASSHIICPGPARLHRGLSRGWRDDRRPRLATRPGRWSRRHSWCRHVPASGCGRALAPPPVPGCGRGGRGWSTR
jgi:hypothetical protein